jgi:hypothetical protein
MKGWGSFHSPKGLLISGGRLEDMEDITCPRVEDVDSVEGVGILAPDQEHLTSTFNGAGAGFFFLITMFYPRMCIQYVLEVIDCLSAVVKVEIGKSMMEEDRNRESVLGLCVMHVM